MEPISLNEMKARFPDEWLLVGNADFGGEEAVGTIMRRLVSGIVLYHSKDKLEVACKGWEARKGFTHCTLIYTGEIPKHLKFWISAWRLRTKSVISSY
jgi:hypothetical protein